MPSENDDWITIRVRWVEPESKPPPKPVGKILEGTSQGGKFDKPPDNWIRSELVEFGALGTHVQPATLQGEIHLLFQRERWPYIDQKRFNALQQSFQLSTKLLAVAAPYLTSFIPETRYQAPPNNHRIALDPEPSTSQLSRARSELESIAATVHFEEDSLMWPSPKGWLGITHTGTGRPGKPFEPEDQKQFRRADQRDRKAGHSHRQLTVGLASQFADVLVSSKDDSEEHLRAAFMAGITLTHEIGHVVHTRHFKNETWWGEPCVGQDIQKELGNALIAWLFNGWTPGPINIGRNQRADMHTFKTGICWNKQLRRPIVQPIFHTVYSMPMAHIQRIMSQKEWDKYNPVKDPWSVRLKLLSPNPPFKCGEHARMAWKPDPRTWAISGGYEDFEPRDDDSEEEYEDLDWDEAATEPKERPSSAKPERKLKGRSKPQAKVISILEAGDAISKPRPVPTSLSSRSKKRKRNDLSVVEPQKARKSRRLAGLPPAVATAPLGKDRKKGGKKK